MNRRRFLSFLAAAPVAGLAARLGLAPTAPVVSDDLMWSDLILGSGAIITFNSGDVTITHSAHVVQFH